tara:strand:- start:26 stop:508 length:483 start_codon:yes stop_codon:yes gene_type:complete
MNQVILSGIALIIAFILLSSKKQSKASAFFKSNKDTLKNFNATRSLVQKKNIINPRKNENQKNLKSNCISGHPSLNSIETKKKLTKLISGKPNDRLLAIQIASQWDNKKALPFLRRGLKDSDSRVVIESAAGIAPYKGKTIKLHKKSQASRSPLNVSLMR